MSLANTIGNVAVAGIAGKVAMKAISKNKKIKLKKKVCKKIVKKKKK